MKRVDFHMHTTHSDGSYTPEELIRYCKEKGLACVSVTDHDTMSSFEKCLQEAGRQGIELVPGVEISAQFDPGTLHILGFFLNQNDAALKNAFEDVQKARRERNPQIVEKLQAFGLDLTLEEVIHEAYGVREMPAGKQLGRPHFAKTLIKKGIVKTHEEAFEKYLSKGKPGYVDKRRLSSKTAISLIRQAGGIASVAHPKQMRLDPEKLEKEIARLVDEGLEAIEVYNSCQNAEDNKLFEKMARRFDLVMTGGSDFHGANKPGVDLGWMGDGIELSYDMVESLRNKIRHRSF
ncbi:MAG: PHP domain-containing protein [Candidatus Omnitrophica bacterium]|nr:PHP domain-containing protein [Candidatus Omnitrophota bacterium]